MGGEKLSRQQRKQLLKEELKDKFLSNYQPNPEKQKEHQNQISKFAQDVQRTLNYTKLIDNHVWILIETLIRLGILSWEDVNETERLYDKREENKKQKIKELLEKEKTVEEYLKEIEEDQSLPGYEKLNINPVKDLNLNPFEVAHYLREKYPNNTDAQFLKIGSVWGLTTEHFGIKEGEK